MATYFGFQAGPDEACFKVSLDYDGATLKIMGAIVTNTTEDDGFFHCGDGANSSNPIFNSAAVVPTTVDAFVDMSTLDYFMHTTPRGPRPSQFGAGTIT